MIDGRRCGQASDECLSHIRVIATNEVVLAFSVNAALNKLTVSALHTKVEG